MILQSLAQYYEDLVNHGRIARPGWARTKINFALCINETGEVEQVLPLFSNSDRKKGQAQQFDLPAAVKRSVDIKSNFLWDNSQYILGIGKENAGKEKDADRRVRCFEECKKLHHQLLDDIDSDVARGIRAFFDRWKPDDAKMVSALQEEYDAVVQGGNLLFRINGIYAYEDEDICRAWENYYQNTDGEKQQCLVTGKEDIIAPVHPSIKGVDGAQSSGAALVSFNAPAFCSYGQEQNYNAPVGKHAAFAYTAALNYLLSDRRNVLKIGDTTIVCWAEGAEPQYQAYTMAALSGDMEYGFSDDDLKAAMIRLAQGLPVPEIGLDPKRQFYILGLAPNSARISVRFFYRDSFGNLMKNIKSHYERMEIVKPSYDTRGILPLWRMLNETVNPNARDKKANPVLAGATARAIFTGGLYPAALLEQTMMRIRAEHVVNRGKAAIIKAYYLRNMNEECPEEVLTVALNEASTNTAYTLGRLFSVFEAVQEAANPGINSTIRDKYYNSAAATPAMIFPVLDNLCQKHLRKLNKGKRIWYEKRIMSLTGILGEEYPVRLSLPQQGSFNLGYYHETQKRYEKKEEA